MLAAALVAPAFVYPIFLMKLLCLALFACAFNLLVGFAGLVSFGHAAFLGMGGYVAGYVIKAWGLTPELAMLCATAVAAALGFAMGRLAIRSHGIYFSMITLALAQLVYFLCLQAPFTGGEDGLQGVPRGKLFGLFSLADDVHAYYFILAVFAFGFLAIYRIVHSPFGNILKSIRENEQRALSLGYDVSHFKLVTFVLSAAISGLAGAAKTVVFGFATLNDVHWHTSGDVLLMTLLGGIGTIWGPVAGSTLVVTLQSELADTAGSKVTIITGLVFIVCVLSFRRGIVGEFNAWRSRRAASKAEPLAHSRAIVGDAAE
jgi:branched-chain amino acid transport system permease protein